MELLGPLAGFEGELPATFDQPGLDPPGKFLGGGRLGGQAGEIVGEADAVQQAAVRSLP